MADWPKFKELGFHRHFPFYRQRNSIFDATYAGEYSTWDYQWQFATASRSGLSVVPKFSLVENIGFGPDATHGTDATADRRYRVPVRAMPFPTTHCRFLYADPCYDRMLARALRPRYIRGQLALAARFLGWLSAKSAEPKFSTLPGRDPFMTRKQLVRWAAASLKPVYRGSSAAGSPVSDALSTGNRGRLPLASGRRVRIQLSRSVA